MGGLLAPANDSAASARRVANPSTSVRSAFPSSERGLYPRSVRYRAHEGPLSPADYAQPYAWWGWHWSPPVPMSLIELVEAKTLDRRAAALLWSFVEARRSVLLASEPPMSGKTTLLSALIPCLPDEVRPLFLRGQSETFDYVAEADPSRSYLLVNEISDHLPVYLWGRKARRMFETLSTGYGFAATMHADDVGEVLGILRQDLGIADDELARIDLIGVMRILHGRTALRGHDDVPPEMRYGGDGVRRRLVSLHLVARGRPPAVPALAEWDLESDEHRLMLEPYLEDVAARTGRSVEAFCRDLMSREQYLADLASRGLRRPREVAEAIAAYRQGKG